MKLSNVVFAKLALGALLLGLTSIPVAAETLTMWSALPPPALPKA